MAMRVSGLNSGLDTDAIVQELVSAYSKKTEKYEKAQTKLSWKQDTWKTLNSKIYGLYNKLSNLRFSSAYSTKKTTVSDNTKAAVSASGSAVNGKQTLNVLSTAQSGYLTGGKIKAKEVDENTTLQDLGVVDGISSEFNVTVDGVKHTVELECDDKVQDMVDKLNATGLNASYDADSKKLILEANEGSSFKVDYDDFDADTIRTLNKLGIMATDTDRVESNALELKYQPEDGKITSETTLQQLGFTHYMPVTFELKTTGEDGEEKNTRIRVSDTSTIEDVVKQFRDAGVNASFDENNGRIFISSKATGKDNDFTLTALCDDDGQAAPAEEALALLGLQVGDGPNSAKKIDGSDAQIRLNGVLYENSSNNFSINGLNIEAQSVTGDGDENAIIINTTTDTQAIYDTVKDFLTEYNNIINEMTKLYNADSAGGYEPLTDEEKDAMSETEIEKWETKIKDSLLRRDTTLDSVMSTMINSMASSIEINGKKYALSTFGIHTMGFLNAAENEHNAFHIDGDKDDENTAGNKEKLMAAITEDPDTVVEFMKQLTGNLYKALDEKMKSTSLSSAYKVYNDKEMDTQYANYTKTISQWEKKITQKEDYYYKKFTAMEKAMAKLQSQTSSLTSLFGG